MVFEFLELLVDQEGARLLHPLEREFRVRGAKAILRVKHFMRNKLRKRRFSLLDSGSTLVKCRCSGLKLIKVILTLPE